MKNVLFHSYHNKNCHHFDSVKKALDYGAVDLLIISKNYDKIKAKQLRTIAENMGTGVEVVSVETTEGEQFFKLGGIGAIQRFGI